MFRAEILWMADGPTLKMAGRLAGEWAAEARRLVTTDVVPKGLIVDLTEVSYIDPAGERLLSWLSSVGAVFPASNVYATAVCERLGLSVVQRIPARWHGNKERSQFSMPIQIEAGPGRARKEEE